ncbi:MAG TPA: GNAT family N-acetyltransferase [Myxococcales bacterium]
MRDRVGLTFRARIRTCRESDLPQLEWYGMHWADRQLIRRAFRRTASGQVRMLVADADGHPVGQVWIDLTAKSGKGIGVVWALRVHPMFRGKGLGERMMLAAERVVRSKGLRWAEIGVDPGDRRAKSFYRRLGYAQANAVGRTTTSWRRPDGKRVRLAFKYDILRKAVGKANGATRAR